MCRSPKRLLSRVYFYTLLLPRGVLRLLSSALRLGGGLDVDTVRLGTTFDHIITLARTDGFIPLAGASGVRLLDIR